MADLFAGVDVQVFGVSNVDSQADSSTAGLMVLVNQAECVVGGWAWFENRMDQNEIPGYYCKLMH